MLSQNLLRRTISRRLAAAAAVSLFAMTSGSAFAVVVCSTAPISVPSTFDGAYINFATGGTGTSGGSTPGWDFNPYLNSTAIGFFWNNTPANTSGGVGVTGGTYTVLASGTSISSASTFINTTSTASAANFAAGSGYLGFRFNNEATGAVNYGWAMLQTQQPSGLPATITQYCYENDGSAITAGTTPVSLQSFSVD